MKLTLPQKFLSLRGAKGARHPAFGGEPGTFRNDRHAGTVMLLSLIIMSAVVIASVGVSILILNSLVQTREVDNSIAAFYAAETGIEDALFTARRLNQTPGPLVTDQGQPPLEEHDVENGAKWSRTVALKEKVLYFTIPEHSFVELALYDPDAEILEANPIKIVQVTWDDNCDGCSALVATAVGWTPSSGQVQWQPNAWTQIYERAANPDGVDIRPSQGTGYINNRLRLRANKADLTNVQIRAFNDDKTQQLDIPGRFRIESRGKFGGTEQRLTATFPRGVPLSSIYDFVIFSECSLVKGAPPGCP